MADTKDVVKADDDARGRGRSEGEGPRQTVRRMPDDQPEVGPFYPSGMSAQEALVSGADADLPEETRAALAGKGDTKKSAKKDD